MEAKSQKAQEAVDDPFCTQCNERTYLHSAKVGNESNWRPHERLLHMCQQIVIARQILCAKVVSQLFAQRLLECVLQQQQKEGEKSREKGEGRR